ncbi:MAG: ABC transporter ATP-binding protein [Eggerthellaceae bacterium]|jgi:putative ABC transport system ATP-binding protein|nr:ABC transporter ATP-binding protein [Eggerthellaceae bacterium]
MEHILLSAQHLSKRYGSGPSNDLVLHDIDLDIYEGDFTVIMGSSGSGKSTLLHCLSGMDSASSGRVRFESQDLATLSENNLAHVRSASFGFVFQQANLVSNLTIAENIAVAGYVCPGSIPDTVNQRVEDLLYDLSIDHIADHLPSQVSGGELQRAAIARALINRPALLFADEPTGALNRRNSTHILNLLTDLSRRSQSILMVTHDAHAALRATRLIYLDDGTIKDELFLPPYHARDIIAREYLVNNWLLEHEW